MSDKDKSDRRFVYKAISMLVYCLHGSEGTSDDHAKWIAEDADALLADDIAYEKKLEEEAEAKP